MPPVPPPTTRQIAQEAGVSHVTVSRALRNQPHVSAPLRAKVLAIAKRLGYQVNPLIGTLMTQMRSGQRLHIDSAIGWLNTHPHRREWRDRPYFRRFLEGANERAEQLGFHIDELWSHEPGMSPARMSHILASRGIRGLLIPPQADPTFVAGLKLDGLAVGFISPPELPGEWCYVESDHLLSITLAMQAVHRAGYRRPGLVVAPLQDRPAQGWRAGFLAEQQHWPKRAHVPVFRPPGRLVDQAGLYQAWLHKHRPDVVIGCDVQLKALAESAGFKVPADLGLVHLHLAEDVPGWAGIDTRDQWIGQAAIDLVANAVRRNECEPPACARHILVPGRWRDGRTLPAKNP